MRAEGQGFYTIGSAGHESNARVAAALPGRRPGPAALPLRRLLPARRATQAGRLDDDALRDVLLGLTARRATIRRPAAGTRSSGTRRCAVIPQTSTIASHLPRAVGRRVRDRPGPPSWRAERAGPRTRSPWQLRRRLASTTRPRRARSTPPATLTQGLPLPLLLVVRGQRPGHLRPDARRLGGGRAAGGPGIRYLERGRRRPGPPARRRRARRSTTSGASAARRCCTCAPCASSVTPAPTSRSATAAGAEIAADHERDPLLATARAIVAAGVTADLVPPATTSSAPRSASSPTRRRGRELGHRAEVIAPLAPRQADRGRGRAADRAAAAQPRARPPSAAGCPRTPGR